jgi:hypothetical protein
MERRPEVAASGSGLEAAPLQIRCEVLAGVRRALPAVLTAGKTGYVRTMHRGTLLGLLVFVLVIGSTLSASSALRAQDDSELPYRVYAPMVASDSSPGLSTTFAAYFFLEGLEEPGGPFLVPVHREVPQTVAVATAAMNALLAGPTAGEASSVPAISSTVPPGTTLLGLTIAGGVANVDLSSEFESGGGSSSVLGRLAQLTYTLTQFPTVDSVRLFIEGEPVTEFSSEGVVIDGPLVREDFEDFLPAIFVDSPHYGGSVNLMRIVGNANVFEATFIASIVDNDGLILAEVPVTATCGTGCRGTFDVMIPYTVTEAQIGALIVFEASAQDGTPQRIREYPVFLVP